jgi:hypothetical protein
MLAQAQKTKDDFLRGVKMSKGWINVHIGEVVSHKNWSDTHVYSSSGAYTEVKSKVQQRVEIFSKDINGKEEHFDFSEIDVPFREGSRIAAVWGSLSGEKTGDYLYVRNLDTGNSYRSEKLVDDSLIGCFSSLSIYLLLPAFIGFCAYQITFDYFKKIHPDTFRRYEDIPMMAAFIVAFLIFFAMKLLKAGSREKSIATELAYRKVFASKLAEKSKELGFPLVVTNLERFSIEVAEPIEGNSP